MNFGGAIQALKEGKRVARERWGGKGRWIILMSAFNTDETEQKVNDHTGENQPYDRQPYIMMFYEEKQWQRGWLPSHADVFSEDWIVI
jgi:hypothetical protein